MYLLVPMQRELSLNFHRNNVYGHFEKVCKHQVSELKVKVDTCLQNCSKCPNLSFLKNSMIAHAALVLKDPFAPRFASIQAILDSVEFFGKLRGNSGYIVKFLLLYVIF